MTVRVLYIFPHPDDESFGPAPAMMAQRRQGHEVHLLTLTRGGATKVRHKLGLSVDEMGKVQHAHHLSACEAVRLLRAAVPSLTATRFKFVLISVGSVRQASALSPGLDRELPRIVRRVRQELCRSDEPAAALAAG